MGCVPDLRRPAGVSSRALALAALGVFEILGVFRWDSRSSIRIYGLATWRDIVPGEWTGRHRVRVRVGEELYAHHTSKARSRARARAWACGCVWAVFTRLFLH
jgi:hypothetical protein